MTDLSPAQAEFMAMLTREPHGMGVGNGRKATLTIAKALKRKGLIRLDCEVSYYTGRATFDWTAYPTESESK